MNLREKNEIVEKAASNINTDPEHLILNLKKIQTEIKEMGEEVKKFNY